MPDEPSTQAFLYGPLVLAGDLGGDGLTPAMLTGPNAPNSRQMNVTVPAVKATDLTPGTKPLTLRAGSVTLAPLNTIFDRRYVVYWQT